MDCQSLFILLCTTYKFGVFSYPFLCMETLMYSYHPVFKMYCNYNTRKTTENYPANPESNYAHNGCEN